MERKKSILIADDTRINRFALKEMFEDTFCIYEAEDGAQAIELLEKLGDEFVAILLDLIMPVKNGFDVLRYLNKTKLIETIPTIVITASDADEDELRAYEYGAADIILKPFDQRVVVRRTLNLVELYESRRSVMSELEARTFELYQSKTSDGLTGMYNMKQFLLRAEQLLRRADRDGTSEDYAFLYCNLRNFKYYNARYGMEKGDQLLKVTSYLIRQISPNDVHARFENDHFAVLLKKDALENRLAHLSADFKRMYADTGVKLKLGVFCVRGKGELASVGCDLAKAACSSIRTTLDTVRYYDEQLDRSVEMETFIMHDFEQAMEQRRIRVYYQPIVRSISGSICAMEASARWFDEKRGVLLPADFMPALEKNLLVTRFDLYVLKELCCGIRAQQAQGIPVVPVSLQLVGADFLQCDLLAEVEKVVSACGIGRNLIQIGVAETALVRDTASMLHDLTRLREAGYQVWLNGFGSGEATLALLRKCEFDGVKLDMDMFPLENTRTKETVKAAVRLAKRLKIQTLAEHITTAAQSVFLQDIGCEKLQGELFSAPCPPEAFESKKLHREVETKAEREYGDRIGAVDFMTDRAAAIIEYNAGRLDYLHANESFLSVWKGLGAAGMSDVRVCTQAQDGPLRKQLDELHGALHVKDGSRSIYASIRGQMARLHVTCLAEHGAKAAFLLEIVNLTN